MRRLIQVLALSFGFGGVFMVDPDLLQLPVSTLPVTLDVRTVASLAIEEAQSLQVQIYPIPADQLLHINFPEAVDMLQVKVYDLTARLCGSSVTTGAQTELPVQDLSNGTYFIQFENYSGQVVARAKFTVLHR